MTAPENTFLSAVKTAVVALVDGSANKYFNKVKIIPNLTQIRERILAPGVRFPCAFIADAGAEEHPHQKKLKTGVMTITVAYKNNRDGQGDHATRKVLDLCDIVREGDGTNPGQKQDFGTGTPTRSLSTNDTPPESTGTGHTEVIYKTLFFEYTLQRS